MKAETPVLLSYAFRPFFLLNGVFAIVIVLVWVATLHGWATLNITSMWHSHEMLVGFAMAAVAGFSLTAVANWTGRPAVQGTPLGFLVFSWLVGRIAMLLTAWLPAGLIGLLDMLFPVMLCVLLGREIIAGRSRRNYQLVIIMALLVAWNALYHLGANQHIPGADRVAIYLLIHTILLLVAIIAARIIPTFTGNWLRQQGQKQMPIVNEMINHLALGLTIVVGLLASLVPTHWLTGIGAFAAALVHGYRLSRWRAFSTTVNPLLFVLHASYVWFPAGYVMLGCSVFGWLFTPTTALHALTMGAIGTMVMAVTTRVALGHTGRPLQAARATVAAYWLLMIAVLIRVLGPLPGIGYLLMIDLSAAGWIASFAIFVWIYRPILTRPRIG